MGFGHRVYKTDDPRSLLLRSVTERLGGPLVEFSQSVERTTVDVLAELKPGRQLYTNVEFYAGVVMHTCGIPREMFTPTFAAGRTIGWSTHVMEQAAHNRLIRPAARYVGPPPPQPVPLPGGLTGPAPPGTGPALPERNPTKLVRVQRFREGAAHGHRRRAGGHLRPTARPLLVPQSGQRGLGPPGRCRRGRDVRPHHRLRPALGDHRDRLRLRGPGPDRSHAQPARTVRHPRRHAASRDRRAPGGGPAEALRPGHGRGLLRDGARPHGTRLLDGGRGVPRPAGRGGLPRVRLRPLPRLQSLRPPHARRRGARRGLRALQRHLGHGRAAA